MSLDVQLSESEENRVARRDGHCPDTVAVVRVAAWVPRALNLSMFSHDVSTTNCYGEHITASVTVSFMVETSVS